jgi:hypothetical protein
MRPQCSHVKQFSICLICYSTAVKGARDYNAKFFEFAQNNTKAAIDFVQKLSGVKSPSDFIELSTDHSRQAV